MFFVYDPNPERTPGRVAPYETWKASDRYCDHYANMLFLQAIVNKPKSTAERLQAQKEIGIAERKMARWQQHPNFDAEVVQRRCEELRKAWGSAAAK